MARSEIRYGTYEGTNGRSLATLNDKTLALYVEIDGFRWEISKKELSMLTVRLIDGPYTTMSIVPRASNTVEVGPEIRDIA